jgi:hypothetical protein
VRPKVREGEAVVEGKRERASVRWEGERGREKGNRPLEGALCAHTRRLGPNAQPFPAGFFWCREPAQNNRVWSISVVFPTREGWNRCKNEPEGTVVSSRASLSSPQSALAVASPPTSLLHVDAALRKRVHEPLVNVVDFLSHFLLPRVTSALAKDGR